MRSRYTAYLLEDLEYLNATWHPDFRPLELALDADVRWLGLEVLACEQRAQRATVEFEARLLLTRRQYMSYSGAQESVRSRRDSPPMVIPLARVATRSWRFLGPPS